MNKNDTIRNFIAHEMLHGALTEPLGDEDQLVESGIIDSLGIMTLLSFLEEKYSIQISSDELIPENFDSVSAVVSLVERETEKQGGEKDGI